jgi:hypothetical protein
MTLTPYVIFCCFLQAGLFTIWFIQLSNHEAIQARVDRETQRGKEMREAGWMACVRSICEGEDEETGNAGQPRRSGFRCACGCCYCFSSACALTFGNWLVLLGLVYLLFIGYGTLESTSRAAQNPECRSGMPTGIYIYILNGCLAILWIVLLLVRCLCASKGLASGVVDVAKDIRLRVAQRKGRKTGSRYAQIGHAGGAGEGDIELALEDADDQVELDHDQLGMDHFLEDDDSENEVFQSEAQQNTRNTKHLAQPKPQRPAAAKISPAANGHANGNGAEQAAAGAPSHMDEDTREMLEMLGSKPEPIDHQSQTEQAPVQYPDDDEQPRGEDGSSDEDGI